MKTAYMYTVLRYVHDTTTGEFVNVGVAICAPKVRYASARCRSTYGRLAKVFPGMDGRRSVEKEIVRESDAAECSERFAREIESHEGNADGAE